MSDISELEKQLEEQCQKVQNLRSEINQKKRESQDKLRTEITKQVLQTEIIQNFVAEIKSSAATFKLSKVYAHGAGETIVCSFKSSSGTRNFTQRLWWNKPNLEKTLFEMKGIVEALFEKDCDNLQLLVQSQTDHIAQKLDKFEELERITFSHTLFREELKEPLQSALESLLPQDFPDVLYEKCLEIFNSSIHQQKRSQHAVRLYKNKIKKILIPALQEGLTDEDLFKLIDECRTESVLSS
jgi:hypothetical protein